jgi:hypothetical protein
MMSPTGLDQLIDEITVDAYNHEEQEAGFLVAAEESLVRRESAELAGTAVEVIRVDCGPDVRAGLRATVRAGGGTHEVALADLAFPDGSDIAPIVCAYRRWLGWR